MAEDGGVLLARFGEVHRDNGQGRTVCGRPITAVAGAITRVLALPGVDAWLRRYLPWLAPEPRSR